MRHPFESWPARHRRGVFLVMVALAVVSLVILQWINADLRTDEAPDGQVSLQLAGSPEEAKKVVDSWRANDVMHKAGLSLGFDYVFMGAYGVAFAGACAAITARCRRRNWSGLAGLGAMAAWGSFAAAGLDAVENALMVPILTNPLHGGAPGLVQAVALAKFALLAGASLYIVGAGLATMRGRPTLFSSTRMPRPAAGIRR